MPCTHVWRAEDMGVPRRATECTAKLDWLIDQSEWLNATPAPRAASITQFVIRLSMIRKPAFIRGQLRVEPWSRPAMLSVKLLQ
jgi:hypothetical protein